MVFITATTSRYHVQLAYLKSAIILRMYALSHAAPAHRIVRELPAAMASLVFAELWYHFGSFTLECAAFLGTWYALSYVGARLLPVKN